MTGTNPDDVLANIDAVLGVPHEVTGDWEVSGDAMRSIPVNETDLPDWEPPARDGHEPTIEIFDETHVWSAAQFLDLRAAVNPGGRRPYRRTMISHPRQAGRTALAEAWRADQADAEALGFDGSSVGDAIVWSAGGRVRVFPTPTQGLTPGERIADWLEEQADLDDVPDEDRQAYIGHTACTMRAATQRLRYELDEAWAASRVPAWLRRVSEWLVSSPLRRAWNRLRRRPATGGTLTLTITANADSYYEAMAAASASLGQAFPRCGVTANEAAASLTRLFENFPAPQMRELRLRAARAELRQAANEHRAELRTWWQAHLDATYADLGLERYPSEPLTPVDEDQLIGYAHAPRVLATLREHQENRP